MTEAVCAICQSKAPPRAWKWIRTCVDCGFKSAELEVRINDAAAAIDETTRETSLATLRDNNFKVVLDHLMRHAPKGGRLLDVGCGHGWFIKMAKAAGLQVTGVEPDQSVLDHVGKDLDVQVGFFPQAVEGRDAFDVIIFNDVFEHIPNVPKLISDVQRFLKPGGLLVLNLPVTDGLYYRAASFLASVGMVSPMERLWQLPFASPHLSYFSHKTLSLMSSQYGFEPLEAFDLKTVSTKGLWARIALSKRGFFYNLAAYCASWVLIALAGFFPSDAHCRIMRRKSAA